MKITSIASALFGSACLVSVCQAAGDPAAIPQATTQNGITYVCGGVGSDEAAQMKQAARDYNLMLTFASRSGNYLSDVNVDIADARGGLAADDDMRRPDHAGRRTQRRALPHPRRSGGAGGDRRGGRAAWRERHAVAPGAAT